jgi:hypothetical protein
VIAGAAIAAIISYELISTHGELSLNAGIK